MEITKIWKMSLSPEAPVKDGRWEKVYASIRLLNEDDVVPPALVNQIWQFRIEVVVDNMVFYQVQRVHDMDLKAEPSVYGWLLNKMVEQLESYIEEGSR